MKNYISLDGKKIELTEKQVEEIRESVAKTEKKVLYEVPVGGLFTVKDQKMIVLEHHGCGGTVAICEKVLQDMGFGEDNNYSESDVDEFCCGFADKMKKLVGNKNVLEFRLDLTSDDGLDDYGYINRHAALLTTDMYRRYVRILDEHKSAEYWWLSTAYSTPEHGSETSVRCVSPSGIIDDGNCSLSLGVRPFCIFDSNIFVS